MKIAIIGFGNAGSKIADTILQLEYETGRQTCQSVLAINSARADLARIENVPDDQQILIGQTNELVKGHGVGSDPELGAEIARSDIQELKRALDEVPIYDIDAFLIVAGLGGGTGSGGGPVLAETLQELYEEPVYGFGILPGREEGGRASLNAGRTLRSFTDAAENVFLFDNDTWREGTNAVDSEYAQTNREIAKRVVKLLSSGELDGSAVSENIMDSSDIRRTLETGGVSTIAYAETGLSESTQEQGGLLDRFRDSSPNETGREVDSATKVKGVVQKAVQSRLTCPADISSAERSLVVLSGPPDEFSRKGLESAREWLEEQTESVEVLAGDDPRRSSNSLSATVVLSNVTSVSRIEKLQQQAVDAKESIEKQAETRESQIQELIIDEQNELNPI